MYPLDGETLHYNFGFSEYAGMHKLRGNAIPSQMAAFPCKEPLSERSARIIQGLPSNPELANSVLVGLLSANYPREFHVELARRAAVSGTVLKALRFIAANENIGDFVRASAAVVLGLAIRDHNMHNGSCKPAFEALLRSNDPVARLDAAYALYLAGFTRFNSNSIAVLSKIVTDERNGWVAAELLRRDLVASGGLGRKHEVLISALEKHYVPAIRQDNPSQDALRLRALGVLDKLSN
jgi:hypothetical protein